MKSVLLLLVGLGVGILIGYVSSPDGTGPDARPIPKTRSPSTNSDTDQVRTDPERTRTASSDDGEEWREDEVRPLQAEILRLRGQLTASGEKLLALSRKSGQYDFSDLVRPADSKEEAAKRFLANPTWYLANFVEDWTLPLRLIDEGYSTGAVVEETDRHLIVELPPAGRLRVKKRGAGNYEFEIRIREGVVSREPFAKGATASYWFENWQGGGFKRVLAHLRTPQNDPFRPGFEIRLFPSTGPFWLTPLWKGSPRGAKSVRVTAEEIDLLDRVAKDLDRLLRR
jgi:hypothetical protein